MELTAIISGVVEFISGFLISEIKNYLHERRQIAYENRRFFYSQLMHIIDPLMDENQEYYKFWGFNKEEIEKNGKSIKMAAYLANIVDAYHSLYKHNLNILLDSEYSVFNKIIKNKISQEYWIEIVRPYLYGGTGHEIVEVVDKLVAKYSQPKNSKWFSIIKIYEFLCLSKFYTIN